MSSIGTGVAAGIAQTALQAQQVARQNDRARNDPARDATRLRERFESHLRGLEESDQQNSAAHLHLDDQLPDHQAPPEEEKKRRPRTEQTPTPTIEDLLAAPPETDVDPSEALYRHLDVQA